MYVDKHNYMRYQRFELVTIWPNGGLEVKVAINRALIMGGSMSAGSLSIPLHLGGPTVRLSSKYIRRRDHSSEDTVFALTQNSGITSTMRRAADAIRDMNAGTPLEDGPRTRDRSRTEVIRMCHSLLKVTGEVSLIDKSEATLLEFFHARSCDGPS